MANMFNLFGLTGRISLILVKLASNMIIFNHAILIQGIKFEIFEIETLKN